MQLREFNSPDEPFGASWNVYADTLERASSSPLARESATAMMNLLGRLEEIEEENIWYATTSHHRLCLSPQARASTGDDMGPVWISASGTGNATAKANNIAPEDVGLFTIAYRMPNASAPWPNATVHMEASNVIEGLAALRVALRECCR